MFSHHYLHSLSWINGKINDIDAFVFHAYTQKKRKREKKEKRKEREKKKKGKREREREREHTEGTCGIELGVNIIMECHLSR